LKPCRKAGLFVCTSFNRGGFNHRKKWEGMIKKPASLPPFQTVGKDEQKSTSQRIGLIGAIKV
jgi:hypothetical protein